ncbi:MFS transporter [Pseudoclavibacter terrae]|uniref:MFS transporter n=1 Tax=Pseudoclavibacter terrae TaxID=1530195 RepID=A0A7J5B083_9MICO|nr:MFS transporter [Pseudoclavibacter terrae]KAB1637273.1 MFS transporter [Pseudoclavibacter terrae]
MRLGRGFRVLWSANALSNLADGIAFVSMPLLAASVTDDPRLVAGLATLYALVRLLVALPIGVWVDRFDRRTLLVAANLLRGCSLLGLALAIQFGVLTLLILYAAMAVVATLESMADNAASAILPSLVDRERLDSANGKVAAAQLVADEFAGPPLGGFLFAVAAAMPVFAMGGLWAVAGLAALALPIRNAVRRGEETGSARRSLAVEVREGTVWLARHRIVGSLALIGALASVGYMLPFSILVLFAEERLGLDGTGYGLLLAWSALGGLLGTFLAAQLRTWPGYRWTIAASLALGAATLGGLAVTTHAIVAGVLLALYILHATVWNVCAQSLRHRLIPDELLGRVGASTRVLSLLGLAVGATLGGLLGSIDLAIPVAVGGGVFVVCCTVAAVTLSGQVGAAPQ